MAHRNSAPSPVSPVQETPYSLPRFPPLNSNALSRRSSSTAGPGGAHAAPVHGSDTSPPGSTQNLPSDTSPADWIPFTLRWYFLLLPIAASISFVITIALLCWYSRRHYGLGKDDGSSAILFGWRFTPTLLAVLYTQITVILFEDVKRTEPFARLAKPPAGGASAYGTLLQTPKAWWAILIDMTFKRKEVGKTGWSLICSALVNVLALLAISPLSSALLASEEVVIPKTLQFSRISPKDNAQFPMNATRETYFRTMAALTRNISTSAWASDTSLTLPFWPRSEEPQLGPDISSTYGAWKAGTSTFHSGFECKNMTLERAEIENRPYAVRDWHEFLYNGTQPMVRFVLTSEDGCRYDLSLHPSVELAYNGGVRWSDGSNFISVDTSLLQIDRIQARPEVSSTSPFARLNTSRECNNRDIILISTPWTAPFNTSFGETLFANHTYKRSPDFRMRGFLCDSIYTMSNQTIEASTQLGKQTTLQNAPGITQTMEKLARTLVDIAGFQNLSLQDTWGKFFDSPSTAHDADPGLGEKQGPGSGSTLTRQVPGFSGLGLVLASLSKFNMTTILDDPDLLERAGRVKSRFFVETLRESLTSSDIVQTSAVQGEVTIVEERVIVLTEIAVALAVLFGVSLTQFLAIFWFSRLGRRPLNLQSDPASTVGMSTLLNPQLSGISTLKGMHAASKHDLYGLLRNKTFHTSHGVLYGVDANASMHSGARTKHKPSRDWRPMAINLWTLLALACLLALILTAVLILNAFSMRSKLYQRAFIYEADVSKFGLSFSSFAPISIAPTVISIIVGLWWDQLDMAFRILQPYIAMSRAPTPVRSGAGLTYRSKSWFGAALKAAKHRHWLLFALAIGSTLCQVLTVSMSALFERQPYDVVQEIPIQRSLDVRQVPIITEIETSFETRPKDHTFRVLNPLYQDQSSNWLYSAAVALSLNGSQLAWTHDEWNFVPLDLSDLPGPDSIQSVAGINSQNIPAVSTNVTVRTPAIRALLECNPVDQIANTSTWLAEVPLDELPENANVTGLKDGYAFSRMMFVGTPASTTVYANENLIQCCANGTNENPQRSVIGYWSPFQPVDYDITSSPAGTRFPYPDRPWPLSFVTKWITGEPRSFYDRFQGTYILYYEKPPSIQAAHCMPVIDIAEAVVTVDKDTGTVHSYELTAEPNATASAWSEVFVRHDISGSQSHYNQNYTGELNITTSFGVLFLDAIFGASDRRSESSSQAQLERVEDNAFNLRDQEHGMNMDLMTYSMYALANKDPEALLNYKVIAEHANRTFQTFFQHFVGNKLSLSNGGWAYQRIDDKSMDALGRPVNENGTAITQRSYPTLDTNQTATASVSNRIQVLHLNSVATYLSAAILIWLIATTAVLACLQRRYTSSMLRNVEVIADVLVLVAGSDNFLRLVQERGVALKKDGDMKTMLGWFKGSDGEVRWGVEVVGGRNAVEWVDVPKHQGPGIEMAPL